MLKLLGNTVLVKEKEDKGLQPTEGGVLLLSSTVTKYPHESEVFAVGQGKVLDSGVVVPVEVEVGDTVIYSKFSDSQEVFVDGEKYLILDGASILAIRN